MMQIYMSIDIEKNIAFHLLDDIMNTINESVLITDSYFNIIYTNLSCIKLFPKIQNFNTKLFIIFPQMQFLEKAEEKIFKNRKFDMCICDNEGEKYLEIILNTVENNTKSTNKIEEHNFFHLFTMRVTQQKKNDIKISGKCLMAFLSHELRNPLQSLTLANHLVKTGLKSFEDKTDLKLPPKILSYTETINKSCIDMKIIINDVLDLSRIEANELIIEMNVCNVHDLVCGIIDDNSHMASNKGLKLIKNIDHDVPNTMFTDITRINQILGNLVSNAIKYSQKGNIHVNVTCDKIKNLIIFDVEDEGVGISDDNIQNLFKTYGRTTNNLFLKENSEGLGLCISQKLANLLGGQITVKTKKDKGSVFTLSHPIKLGASGNNFIISLPEHLSCNILLVDDNYSNLSLLHMLLDNFNYEYMWSIKTESVNNGKDAIELCKVNNYDLIFMDINMNGIDGCTTSKIIKNNGFVGKIIATTGNILSKNEDQQFGNCDSYKHFDDILIKPFDDKIVLKILQNFLFSSD